MKQSLVKKAIFPVAGLGTRFLPVTKASPKEMLPIVDKPLIQYAVEEAVGAGITELIFITSSSKRSIEDHFDFNFELETKLAAHNKKDLLYSVQKIIPAHVTCIYLRQPQPLGLGHAILQAKSIIGNEPCAVLLADDLIDGYGFSCLQQMIQLYEETLESIIAVEAIKLSEADKYGIIIPASDWEGRGRITGIIEKPKPTEAPSKFAAVGRYILHPAIFECLQHISPGKNGEIQLTDAIALLLLQMPVQALAFVGKRYDCGNKFGYLQATIEYALRHPEVSHDLKNYLLNLAKSEIAENKTCAVV